jgi:N4-gp56 family major capsid protein
MATNLATKYSSKVDERFSKQSVTEKWVHNDYDWDGVQTIKVYSIPTVALGSYSRTGTSRYGTPADLGDTLATYTLTQDKAFTYVIDKGDNIDSLNVRAAAKSLSRQTNEVVIPAIDKYRLAAYVTAAAANGGRPAATNITTSNAYSSFLQAQGTLDDILVPDTGRVCFVTPKYLNTIKQDGNFIKASDMAQDMLVKGQVGEIDGVAIVKAPTSYFPTKTPFILTHKSVMCAPKKLQDYQIHENPPGISGNLVEGRLYYDAFVMDSRKTAIYAWLEV